MKLYNKILKKPWSYTAGAVILALLNIILVYFNNRPWGISQGFLSWGIGLIDLFGFKVDKVANLDIIKNNISNNSFFINKLTVINIAVIIGAFIATMLAAQFKVRKIKNKKQLMFGLLGGILIGYGSRLALGCNVGGFYSAIPLLTIQGWIFLIFMFLGSFIGVKILYKYLM